MYVSLFFPSHAQGLLGEAHKEFELISPSPPKPKRPPSSLGSEVVDDEDDDEARGKKDQDRISRRIEPTTEDVSDGGDNDVFNM